MNLESLKKTDPEVMSIIEEEIERQNKHIELIASENFVSKAVLEAMGSQLTNKYAEPSGAIPTTSYFLFALTIFAALREFSAKLIALCATLLLGIAPIESIDPTNLLYSRARIAVILTPSHLPALKSSLATRSSVYAFRVTSAPQDLACSAQPFILILCAIVHKK